MPVAIVRMRVADLPARFELDDRQAMSPDMRPSQFSELSISARVARSGEAMPSAGDWVSDAVTVRRGERGVHDVALRIERVQR
jgi:cytochrome c-type biogenesis protein CcmH